MDKIFLEELKVETIIGIWDWERKIRQTVVIDLEMSADIGFGDGYGDFDELPFFENYFAGGVRSVRRTTQVDETDRHARRRRGAEAPTAMTTAAIIAIAIM